MVHKLFSYAAVVNFIGLLVVIVIQFNRSEKVAYVDSSKVINSYQGMIDARAEYQQKVTIWKLSVDTLLVEVQRDMMNFQNESSRMTKNERQLTQQLIQNKQQQLAERQSLINDQAKKEDSEATKRIVNEINQYLKNYGEANNYELVLAATEYGNIAYAKDYLDITERVIEGMNNDYKKRAMK